MPVSAFMSARIFVAILLLAAISPPGRAQVVSTVAPPLGDDSAAAPVTTLSIDLLAPQRPFTYDPTGASVLANAFDPAIHSSDMSAAEAQTDTALRDSSQTGHISPFAPETSRIGVSFSGSVGARNPLAASDSLAGGEDGDADSELDERYGGAIGIGDRSSWGSSAFGPQAVDSAWGVKAMTAPRLGVSQPAASDTAPPLQGEFGSKIATPRNNLATSRNNQRSSNQAWLAPRPSESSTAVSESVPKRPLRSAGIVAGAQSADLSQPASSPLLSLPRSNQDYAFGESPFSSPAGRGELSFLNPNILSVGALGLSPSSVQAGPARRDALRQSLDPAAKLETSATHYGFALRARSGVPGPSASHSGRFRKNPYLTGDELPSSTP